ncbi:NADH-quinone oxidoreductase subunit NuoG [Geopsychrobacter electrodiphilus]|uniref:NADH-quinone oxidoreductase subunit NuoG n=1 Tax=Geopsychrobacter electrodiphilus TaxID=225196 RepID=UPI000379CFCD|nr:NADH-quinone oxidoreductase subunit NuoG [Geopsychrobacter electrodiphilus]
MPTLTIDNQTVTVSQGATVLDAAIALGIMVPHFCYHQVLGAVGACRQCAVTIVAGTQKGLKMSCLIPAEDGMVVLTGDVESSAYRAQVSEWLMTNHPHDCPVCDEGGECQLQEMTIGAGHGIRRYRGNKRTYQNQQLGPFIEQEMNRCIQCYRCARTYKDYCGGTDFGVMGSQQRIFFGRFKDGELESDFSGNLVDFCPTGVFTDKTNRFKTRYWDLQQAASICPHCSLGCSTLVGGRYQEVQRVRAGDNRLTNDSFICDRARFGSDWVNHPERPREARIAGERVDMSQALAQLEERLLALKTEHGGQSLRLLGSPRASFEANLLLKKLAERLGAPAPYYDAHPRRAFAARVAARIPSGQLASLQQVRAADLVVVVGVDPLAEAPVLALALRQVVRSGGRVVVFDPRPVELPCEFEHYAVTQEKILRALSAPEEHEKLESLRQQMEAAQRPLLVGGGDLLGGEGFKLLRRFSESCCDTHDCLIFPVLHGANSFGGGLLSSGEPQRDLLEDLENGKVRGLICLENDPAIEHCEPGRMQLALARLELLAVFDHLPTHTVAAASHFLPTRTLYECGGTFINNEGRMQAYAPLLDPGLPLEVTGAGSHPPRQFEKTTPGGAPASAVHLLQLLLKDRQDLFGLRRQIVAECSCLRDLERLSPGDSGRRIADCGERVEESRLEIWEQQGDLRLLPISARYGSDQQSRLSQPLAPRLQQPCLWMHPEEAAVRGFVEGQQLRLRTALGHFHLPLQLKPTMARNRVLIPCLPGTPLEVFTPGGLSLPCQLYAEAEDA